MFCWKNNAVKPLDEILLVIDEIRRKKYGITEKRYRSLLAVPNMTHELLDHLHENGIDLSDTSNDLQIFATLQKPRQLTVMSTILEEQ